MLLKIFFYRDFHNFTRSGIFHNLSINALCKNDLNSGKMIKNAKKYFHTILSVFLSNVLTKERIYLNCEIY